MTAGVLAAMATLAAAFAASGAVAAASPVGREVSAIATMRAQRSYHYVSTATQLSRTGQVPKNGTRVTIVGDATHSEGIQRITFAQGSKTGHVTVLVVANTAYIRGDAFTLVHYMDFSATDAAGYAGKWLRLPHTDPAFAGVANDVRLDSSATGELKIPSPRAIGTALLRGQRVIGLRGTIHQSGVTSLATLYVRATGAPLPVEVLATYKGKIYGEVVFGNWGERVDVPAPPSAIALH
jgi:hypothetical protein